MKKILFVFTFITSVSCVLAQDVIVKKDGSTILSKVIEVNPTDIKYKKHSNLDGPLYTISINDIFSINYSNGEKETFDKFPVQTNSASNTRKDFSSSFINDGLISEYNDRDVTCNIEKSNKKAKWIYRLLRIHNQSLIANDDIRMIVEITQSKDFASTNAILKVSIENTSDKLLYLDLANCTFRKVKQASTYYVNSSTTQSSGREGGGSVNMGSIASVLGIGGAIGTIASGTTLGGNKSSGTSTTIYADRIITVPPHSIYNLPSKDFYISLFDTPYKTDFKYGDRFKYIQPIKIENSPWEIILSYSSEDALDVTKKLDMALFISEEISVKASWDDCIKNETPNPPIHYYYRVDD